MPACHKFAERRGEFAPAAIQKTMKMKKMTKKKNCSKKSTTNWWTALPD
jgi:hypothetical protein